MFEILKKGQTTAPIRSWLPHYEVTSDTYQQLENAANHADVGVAVAAMPDMHVGYGVPIGCVFPTMGAIVPNAVGVDIGCGMAALDTGIAFDDERMGADFWSRWAAEVNRRVPTGFHTHKDAQDLGNLNRDLRAKDLQSLMETKVATQLGTLGGGNHFLEAQVDERGMLWLMVHSGSRHTGLRIAGHYHDLAKEQTQKRGIKVDQDLSALLLDTQEGQDYLHDMQWATDFAKESRRRMLLSMILALEETAEVESPLSAYEDSYIDCRHNYAEMEEHEGMQQMVHRKGATNARLNQVGIIPGSMGSSSFIVRGKGNADSLESCSHGAGRSMGRGAAKRKITEDEFRYALQGTFSQARMGYVDEAPQAYKNVEVVMSRQVDLVDIVHTLRPLMTVKGSSKARDD